MNWDHSAAATRALSVRLRLNRDSFRNERIQKSRIVAYVMSRDSSYPFQSVTSKTLWYNFNQTFANQTWNVRSGKRALTEGRDRLRFHSLPPQHTEAFLASQSLLQLASLVICRSNRETRDVHANAGSEYHFNVALRFLLSGRRGFCGSWKREGK